jgi:DNA-directed RNA polymerase
VLKDEFVALHSQPIMENLRHEFVSRYGTRRVLNVYTIDEMKQRIALQDHPAPVADPVVFDDDVISADGTESLNPIVPDVVGLEEADEETANVVNKLAKNRKYVHEWEKVDIPALPARGDFDIRDVAKSEYFFS